MKETIGLLMVVRNEIERLEECLEWHLPYVDQVAICDQSSEDGTWELLQRLAAENPKITIWQDINHGYCEPSKQATSDLLKTEWVLYLDPDEKFPEAFLKRMHKVVAENDLDGYVFPRSNKFKVQVYDETVPIEPKFLVVEHPSKDYQLRLTRRSLSTFPKYLHNRVRVRGVTNGKHIGKMVYVIEHLKTVTEQWADNGRYGLLKK